MESTVKKLDYYFNEAKSNSIEFVGYCYDCGKEVTVKVDNTENMGEKEVLISGGAVYIIKAGVFLKCDECYGENNVLHNFQPCEVYSRVVGFLRPVKSWNPGKQEEFKKRKVFDINSVKQEIAK